MTLPPPTPDEVQLYLSQIEPAITEILIKENLLEKDFDEIMSKTMAACLNIRRVANKQRIKQQAFARRIAWEQLQIWLAVNGNVTQQAKAMSIILAENRDTVRRFLTSNTFRTNDTIDDVLSESFTEFWGMIQKGKPIIALISTVVKGIARIKTLKQLKESQKHAWQWLETAYVSAGDEEIGTFDYPVATDEEDEPEVVEVTLPLIPGIPEVSVPKRIEFDKAKRAIADCLAQLQQPRQLLVRLVNAFWKGYEDGPLSQEQILSSYDKLSMSKIAEWVGYKDAHTASVRLTETNKMLRKCLDSKLNTFPLTQ